MTILQLHRCVLLSFFALLSTINKGADSVVTFFIDQYPEVKKKEFLPEKINSSRAVKGLFCSHASFPTAGIIATYGGYITTSNISGQVIFPFIGQTADFLFLITESITPVIMIGNTVHHWEISPTTPAKSVSVVRNYDKKTQTYFWNVQPVENPKKNIIPLNAIVILQKPNDIIIPSGITITSSDAQFRLPPIYAKGTINRVTPALHALRIKNFFNPVKIIYKKQQELYYSNQIAAKLTAQ